MLNQNNTISDRTNLSVNDNIEALNICLKSTVFSFKNVLYRQIFGVPMGSCISPILADIFMEFVEHKAISTFHTSPKLWARYVDDTFCVIKQQYAEEFHKHLNSISLSITFTPKREQNQSLTFLDQSLAFRLTWAPKLAWDPPIGGFGGRLLCLWVYGYQPFTKLYGIYFISMKCLFFCDT